MEETPLYIAVALLAFAGIVLLLARPSGIFTTGRGRLPKRFELRDLSPDEVPPGAREPLDFLTKKLASLGFTAAGPAARIPALEKFGHRLMVMPFAHLAESTFFIMGVELQLLPKTELMLHIITPMTGGRRVETSTLAALEMLAHPSDALAVRIVLDAESVEEIWSRHRLALSRHPRADRAEIALEEWRGHAAAAYEGWLQSGVRAQRLTLEADGQSYRVRSRPKSFI